MDLDSPTRTRLEAAIGDDNADLVGAAAGEAFVSWVRSLGVGNTARLGFTMVPGADSHSPMQLSAPPIVRWIDRDTLGVFGFYGKDALGGDPARNTATDLPRDRLAYFDLVPGDPKTVRRAHPIGVLVSTRGFQLTVACPLITRQVVRALLADERPPAFLGLRHAVFESLYREQLRKERLERYLQEEWLKAGGTGPRTDAQRQRAEQRLEQDVQARVAAEAEESLNSWLHNPPGQQAITESTPHPAATGRSSPIASRSPWARSWPCR